MEFIINLGPFLTLNSTTDKEFRVYVGPFLTLNSTTDKEFRVNLGSHIGQKSGGRVFKARFRVIIFLIAQAEGCHACGEQCLDLATPSSRLRPGTGRRCRSAPRRADRARLGKFRVKGLGFRV